jgi:two-component system chemotaxis sensor kinase CheA
MTDGAVLEGFGSLVQDFALDARERLDRVEQLLLDGDALASAGRAEGLKRLKAELHTVKGNAGMMGFSDLQAAAHGMEDAVLAAGEGPLDVGALLGALDRFRDDLADHVTRSAEPAATPSRAPTGAAGSPAEGAHSSSAASGGEAQGSVRVPFAVLDPLLDQIAEMVILRNRLAEAIGRGRGVTRAATGVGEAVAEAWIEAQLAHDALGRVLDEVQGRVMRLRLTPLHGVFGSLRRLVHDESVRGGKEAVLAVLGGDTPLDKALLELASEVLGHLVRNAVIHGLEAPEARLAAGKPRVGTVRVTAGLKGDDVLVEVSDDGAGIDPDGLRRAAARKGFALAPEADPFGLLFEAGFSTKDAADLGAGRGVGLAAVREAVRRQGGQVRVASTPGLGTTFSLRLPMTVSIARALLLRADGELYALPLAQVVESRRMRPGESHAVNHAGVLAAAGSVTTLLDLGCHFGTAARRRESGYVVVMEATGRRRGLVADAILGLQEVVVRGLDPILGRPAGVAGSTVLGDGTPILILDPRALVDAEPFVREAA